MDHLHHEEFKTLICALDRNKLTSWIFEKLLDQINHQQSETDIDRIRSKISEIIKSRTHQERDCTISDAEESSVVQPLTLNDLPNVLFPEISSFLDFKEKLSFEKTNRTIFIGSRSCSLPLHPLHQRTFSNLIHYRSNNPTGSLPDLRIKSLSVDCSVLGHECDSDGEELEEWTLSYNPVQLGFIEKVQSLTMESWYDDQLSAVLDSFILNQSESFPNIKYLRIESEEYQTMRDIEPSLNTLVSRCSGLEYFEIFGMYIDDADFSEYEWVSNLKGIAVDACDRVGYQTPSTLSVKLHSALSSKVESLHLASLSLVNALNCNLSNLKELCLIDTPSNGVFEVNSYRILLKQNLSTLKRVNYSCSAWKKEIGDSHVIMLWMKKMLKSVEYFCMKFEDTEILRIMEVVRSVVKQSNVTGRSLKLRFNYIGTSRFEKVKDLIEGMERMFIELELKHFDWILIVRRLELSEEQKNEVHAAANELRNMEGYCVDLKERNGFGEKGIDIVIRGNQKHCIQEPWNMTCCNCPSQNAIFK